MGKRLKFSPKRNYLEFKFTFNVIYDNGNVLCYIFYMKKNKEAQTTWLLAKMRLEQLLVLISFCC